jgi:hypothetical protein
VGCCSDSVGKILTPIIISDRCIFINADIEDYEGELRDYNSKIGFMSTGAHTAYFNAQNYQKGILHVMPEDQLFIPVLIVYPKYSVLIWPINRKILNYQSSGLIDFWASRYVNNKYLREWKRKEHQTPKPLKFVNIQASIAVLLTGHLLSIITFCLEYCWWCHKGKFFKKTKNLAKIEKKYTLKQLKLKTSLTKTKNKTITYSNRSTY